MLREANLRAVRESGGDMPLALLESDGDVRIPAYSARPQPARLPLLLARVTCSVPEDPRLSHGRWST